MVKTAVVISDIQCPYEDQRAINVALKLVKAIKPEEVIIIGDFISADAVSKFGASNWEQASKTLKDELACGNRLLDKMDKVFNKLNVKSKVFLAGNHEDRIQKWLLKNGANLGDLDELKVQNLLHLKQRGYEFISTVKQPYTKIPGLNIVHGYYANQYHAAKTVNSTHRNVLYAHTHDVQMFTSPHFKEDEPKIAQSIGCLCDYSQPYMNGRTNNWVHAIAKIEYDTKGFTTTIIPIVKYRTIYNGKLFKG